MKKEILEEINRMEVLSGILKESTMKVYTFETEKGSFEYYDLRRAKKKALEIAKEINDEVLVTCMHKPSYKQDWFTAMPDGRFLTDLKGYRADN